MKWFKNLRIADLYTCALRRGALGVEGGYIKEVVFGEVGEEGEDCEGLIAIPSLVDAHLHLESSFLTPRNFAEAAVPHGLGTVLLDPHEIANVAGLEGVRRLVDSTRGLPLNFYFAAPSCVPATPFVKGGGVVGVEEIREMAEWDEVVALGEVMNYPGVLSGDEDLLAKVRVFLERGKRVDGHCPGLRRRELSRYISAGITSDHESTSLEEGMEKLSYGMLLMIREGSAAKNADALFPLLTSATSLRVALVSDDVHGRDLLRGGLISVYRKGISKGLDPFVLLRALALSPALHYGLPVGRLAPGARADFFLVEEMASLRAVKVFYGGELVAEEGKNLWKAPDLLAEDPFLRSSFKLRPEELTPDLIRVGIPSGSEGVRVVEVRDGSILTREIVEDVCVLKGRFESVPEKDLLKVAVFDRYGRGSVGLGFVRGFGLRRGGVASSVSHDCHNLVAVGVSDDDLLAAAKRVLELGGGQVVVENGNVVAELPLPVAGLISDRNAVRVAEDVERLKDECRRLGSSLSEPLMTLSFVALEVIPSLRITSRGLFSVDEMKFVDLFV